MGPSANPAADGEKHLSPTSSDTTEAAAGTLAARKQQPKDKRSVFDPRRRNALRRKLPSVIKGPLNGEQARLIPPDDCVLTIYNLNGSSFSSRGSFRPVRYSARVRGRSKLAVEMAESQDFRAHRNRVPRQRRSA